MERVPRKRRRSNSFASLSLGICLSCAATLPKAFTSERDAAQQAYARGNYREAAGRWERARERAPSARERIEATYRMAASLERAGDRHRAQALYAEISAGENERAARAAFENAEITTDADPQVGWQKLRAAILRFPDAGLARRGTLRLLNDLQKRQGAASALRELDRLLNQLGSSDLAEFLLFERARRVQQAGEPARARDLYLDLARRFPYPRGVFWDDALLEAARLEVSLGRSRAALHHLTRLLSERETARLSGSYERKSYAEARFLMGEIHRDHLGEPDRARRAFRRVFLDHPTSRLGDDALFEETLVALRQGNQKAACEAAQLLASRRPDSRFRGCVALLCPALGRSRGPCRTYLKRVIEQALEPARDAGYSSSSR